MLKKRKAQGFSIRVIIIAAIALIVLVVLVALFTGKFRVFSSGITKVLSENVPWLASVNDEEKGPEDVLGDGVDGSIDSGSNVNERQSGECNSDYGYSCKINCDGQIAYPAGDDDCPALKPFCCQ